MTDVNQTVAPNTIVTFELPALDGSQTFDCATIPADARLDLLKGAVRTYVANRVNVASQRYGKQDDVVAWNSYNEAQKADPLQSTVAKPTNEAPAPFDAAAVRDAAYADLLAGNIKTRTTAGTGKSRERADPLTQSVTKAVVNEVFKARKAADPKYTFIMAAAEVGKDGVLYLNNAIAAKLAAVAEGDRAALKTQLEKSRDERYINPAKIMLGIDTPKRMNDLPSIL